MHTLTSQLGAFPVPSADRSLPLRAPSCPHTECQETGKVLQHENMKPLFAQWEQAEKLGNCLNTDLKRKPWLLVETHGGQEVNATAEALGFALYRSKRRTLPNVAGFLADTEMEELAKKKRVTKIRSICLELAPEFARSTVQQRCTKGELMPLWFGESLRCFSNPGQNWNMKLQQLAQNGFILPYWALIRIFLGRGQEGDYIRTQVHATALKRIPALSATH